MEILPLISVLAFSSIFCIFIIALYFLPTIIAYKRGHANKGYILLLNFLLGWTFIGWAGALIWAFIDTDGSKVDGMFRTNRYDDLEKLQKLKEAGTITEEEFEKEKAKILK